MVTNVRLLGCILNSSTSFIFKIFFVWDLLQYFPLCYCLFLYFTCYYEFLKIIHSKNQDRIALWLKSNNKDRCTKIGARWKKCLEMNRTILKFQEHKAGKIQVVQYVSMKTC